MARSENFQVASDLAKRGAADYRRVQGIYAPARRLDTSSITMSASRRIGAAYDALPEHDESAVPAFKQMREETGRQFDHMTKPRSKGGMGINVEVTKEDPYGFEGEPKGDYSNWHYSRVATDFANDVVNHNRMKVYDTASTGEHPLLSNDENNMFRAVHDVFGHLGSSRGVDHHGEEAAYQKHSSMFSPLARQAMATETRGQNSSLRIHGEFQPQKVALLPEHLQNIQFASSGSSGERREASAEAARKSREQGII